MANKFVWSGAGGLNDGSSWDNAYTSLMRDWGVEGTFDPATDFVYVRSVHAESTAAALTISGTAPEGTNAPVQVRCVEGDTTGTTPGALATGASVTTTGTNDISILEKIYIYGVDFIAGDDVNVGDTQDSDIVVEQGLLRLNGGVSGDRFIIGNGSSRGVRIRLVDTDLQYGHASNMARVRQGEFIWDGGSVLGTGPNDVFDLSAGRSTFIKVHNVDLSGIASGGDLWKGDISYVCKLKFSRCLLPASWNLTGATIDIAGTEISTFHCQNGTDSDPAYQMETLSYFGSVKADTARYRTGGASDGERTNPISWDMDTSVGSQRSYPAHALESPPIVGWTDGDGSTAHTYRIYFASGASQGNDDIWFDLVGPNNAATDSLGLRNTTRVAPESSPSNYTTDGDSTWTGTDVGTKQYMEITYTPDKPGPISAVIHMAVGSERISIDPQIVVDP